MEPDKIREQWENEVVPDIERKEDFVDYLTILFMKNQLKLESRDYIEPYVETKFKLDKKWAIAVKLIRENYRFFRMIGWTEIDYTRCLSLCMIKDKIISRKELLNIYNDYKAGLYDNYFLEDDLDEFN